MAKPNKQIIEQIKGASNKSYAAIEKEKLSISFDYIDWGTEIFFIHGLDEKYYHHLFDLFSEIKKSISDQIKLQTHPRLNPKSIRWKSATYITQPSFPTSVLDKIKASLQKQTKSLDELQKQTDEMIKDAFELMVTKNHGRVHGFLFANKFHIVWFDPAHNLFPGMENGKKEAVKLPSQIAEVRTCKPEEFSRLRNLNISLVEENEKLKKENDELTSLLEIRTEPPI